MTFEKFDMNLLSDNVTYKCSNIQYRRLLGIFIRKKKPIGINYHFKFCMKSICEIANGGIALSAGIHNCASSHVEHKNNLEGLSPPSPVDLTIKTKKKTLLDKNT